MTPRTPIRALVVDDSVVIRRLVTHALSEDPAIEVIGTAANGVIALKMIAATQPDVVTLDIEMPEMDGLETLRRIRNLYPRTVVIMFSTLSERGAAVTLEALSLGANDYVTKAANIGSLDVSLARLRDDLVPKIKQFFRCAPLCPAVAIRPLAPAFPRPVSAVRKAVAIGVSTGGPNALAELIPLFPPAFTLPVFIVQHMPPIFTRMLAERLQGVTKLRVLEASDGMKVKPGTIYIAPGDFHMRVSGRGMEKCLSLDRADPENFCRPSVDPLFRSVAEVYGGAAVAVILTGMGQDGRLGAERLRHEGAWIIAQDEASSVVWGMPGAVVRAGLSDVVTDLKSIVPEILKQAQI